MLAALSLGFLISGSQVFFDLRNERSRIDHYVSEILKSTKSAAADAAYELDSYYAQSIVDGMVKYESLANVSIYDDRNNPLAYAGISVEQMNVDWLSNFIVDKHTVFSTELIRYESGEVIGSIRVAVNAKKLGDDFLTRAKIIFISGFFRSMFLMLIFLVMFYFVLSRPLVKAIREISQVDDADTSDEVTLASHLVERKDELGELVESFLNLLSRRRQAEERLRHMAFHDDLTDLPNRALLIDRLNQALLSAQRNDFYGGLIFLDLDDFKNVNDALGHPVGDMLIRQVAQRLVDEFRVEDTVSRFGGDEFIILLPNLGKTLKEAEWRVQLQAEKICASFARPYLLDEQNLTVKPSIGITLFPDQNSSVDDLLKQADTAMYKSKSDGGDRFSFYQAEMQDKANKRLSIEKELREALSRNEFKLFYQPQCDATGRVIGVEALLRWNHPVRRLVSPDDFIFIAEASGLIIPIGEWVLTRACSDLSVLNQKSASGKHRMSVNVSARQFKQDDFVERVKAIMHETGIDPHSLTLEVTESIMIGDIAETTDKLLALQKLGVEFSIDDFGTGYSSLQYLQQMPFKEIKIDRSFVIDIEKDKGKASIVTTILSMACNLNMRVVSEGVETEQQFEFLKRNGCDVYQGFYFSRPLPIEGLTIL